MILAHRLILPALILILALLLPSPSLAGQYEVTRVVDGDTIVVSQGNDKVTIRLVGIDAPETSKKKHEPGQPFSQTSTKHIARLVLNRTVDIEPYGKDRYGRTLAEVLLDGKNINIEMVKVGLAEVYRGTPAPGQNLEPYWKAEEKAKDAKRGIWVLGDKYVSPREWRRTDGQ